ncbi:heterokaryon incompatibility protein [Diplodia corticola]|uniref:Heterokaryon incompatibility protein n=1 Tax=Diplodia corticola TaxID=236234 RepID=A0A1J9RH48_9PEZI|nr:heterokaryon incompatibility protein [Diplodia corticola]OJD39753.1 heterokaryon incompatibility protein [Diplodia corticola]
MGKRNRKSKRKGKNRMLHVDINSDEWYEAGNSGFRSNGVCDAIGSQNNDSGPLCKLCSSTFSSPKEGWPDDGDVHWSKIHPHQATLAGLLRAKNEGCYVCSILYQELRVSNRLKEYRSVFYRIEVTDFDVESILYGHFSTDEIPEESASSSRAWEDIVRLGFYKCDRGFPESLICNQLSESTKTEESLVAASEWLHACRQKDEDHSMCTVRRNHNPTLPTRLVYCGSDVDPPRVCESATLPPCTEYLTLSHCWGTKPIFSLTVENEERLKAELPKGKLTRSFLDAIFVTRALKFEYIWIDSLCIIQDSHEDWAAESVTMGSVYANAVLNIAATGVASGEKGFFATRDAAILPPLKLGLNLGQPWPDYDIVLKGEYWLHKRTFDDDVDKAPLNTRGWVLQERILSPRILHFGSNQIYWECPSLVACEVFPRGFPTDVEFIRKGIRSPAFEKYASQAKGEIYGQWRGAVQSYSSRAFTKRRDRFRAIWGIASEMGALLEDDYVAGLWKGDLLRELLWIVHQENEWPNRVIRLSLEYEAPTWSWLSLNARLSYTHTSPTGDYDEFHAELLDVQVTSLDTTGYGPFSDGHILAKGPVKKVTAGGFSDGYGWFLLDQSVALEIMSDFDFDAPWRHTTSRCILTQLPTDELEMSFDWGFLPRHALYLFPIRSGLDHLDEVELQGLLLAPTSRAHGEYHRIGVFTVGSKLDQQLILGPTESLGEHEYEKDHGGGQYSIKIV